MINSTSTLKEAFITQARSAGLDPKCVNDGAFHAEIAIVGEAPGDREIDVGRPLVGASGSKLWEHLRTYGITRQNTYSTNVSKRQVSFGDDKRNPINKHEADVWSTLLMWELSQLPNLKYILVLGNMSLHALTGKTGITDWRGSVLLSVPLNNGKPVDILCSYNPAMILREPKLELTFRFDMSKLDKLVKGNWIQKGLTTYTKPSFSDAMDWLDRMSKTSSHIAYDIEVIANETACIGLADNDVEGMCINFYGDPYTHDEEVRIRKRFQQLANSSHDKFVAQNNMFDSSWLWFKDKLHVGPIYTDTMLAHHVLYPQLPHNLGYLTTQYTTRPFYKNEKDDWKIKGDINDFWNYNVQDCCNTHAIATHVVAELRQQQLDKFFFNHVMRLQPHLLRMTVGGVLVDTDVRDRLKDEIGTRVSQLLDEFHASVREVIDEEEYEPNPKSPKQMTDLLFSRLRLVGRGVSTNAENRERMYSHPATTEPKRKILRAINEYSTEQKFYSTYVQSSVDDDNRMRCTYNQTGVVSAPGRLSSSGMLWKNKLGEQTGMNLQNQPERAYELYIADQGYGLGYFDMAQAEARLVACFADIPLWLTQFEKARLDGSYDAHRALASDMFAIPYDQVPTFDRYDLTKGHVIPVGKRDRDVTLRFIAKRCRHGLNYRMGPDRLSSTTGLNLADATSAYRTYHKITPELQLWWSSLEQEVTKTKTLFNAFGRRFIVLERLSPESLESIVAFKPQSTLGDHVANVISQSEEDSRWPSDARMWLNIHDALVCLAPRHKVKLCLSIMKYYAELPILAGKHSIIIPAETKIGHQDDKGFIRWSTLKPIQIEAAKAP